jgi:hypothetical protein
MLQSRNHGDCACIFVDSTGGDTSNLNVIQKLEAGRCSPQPEGAKQDTLGDNEQKLPQIILHSAAT